MRSPQIKLFKFTLLNIIDIIFVRFEVSTAVTMMIIIFWEMTPWGSYKNRRFGGSYRLHLQGARVRVVTERSCKLLYRHRLVEERSVICSHSCTLKMEAIRSSETSVLIRATRRHLPEDDNHHDIIFISAYSYSRKLENNITEYWNCHFGVYHCLAESCNAWATHTNGT
jgi:hypothetical protein